MGVNEGITSGDREQLMNDRMRRDIELARGPRDKTAYDPKEEVTFSKLNDEILKAIAALEEKLNLVLHPAESESGTPAVEKTRSTAIHALEDIAGCLCSIIQRIDL